MIVELLPSQVVGYAVNVVLSAYLIYIVYLVITELPLLGADHVICTY